MVGFAGLAEFVPAVIAALYAGHYIDKHNKKYPCLVVCFLHVLRLSTRHDQLALFAVSQYNSCYRNIIYCFLHRHHPFLCQPAATSMIAAIVSREQLPKAISYNSSTLAYIISLAAMPLAGF